MDEGFQRVASLAEVPEGELRAYDLPTGRVAVAHVENELFAFGDECTHEGCSLAEGQLGGNEESVVARVMGASSISARGNRSRVPPRTPCRCSPFAWMTDGSRSDLGLRASSA